MHLVSILLTWLRLCIDTTICPLSTPLQLVARLRMRILHVSILEVSSGKQVV